jgi:hypothetical protein
MLPFCANCHQPFTPRRPYHRYCDACSADLQAAASIHGKREAPARQLSLGLMIGDPGGGL